MTTKKDILDAEAFFEKVAALCNEHRMAIVVDDSGEIWAERFLDGDRIGQEVRVELCTLRWDYGDLPRDWKVGRWRRPIDWDEVVVADNRVPVEPIQRSGGEIAQDRQTIAWMFRTRFVSVSGRCRAGRMRVDQMHLDVGADVALVGGRHDPTG